MQLPQRDVGIVGQKQRRFGDFEIEPRRQKPRLAEEMGLIGPVGEWVLR